MAKDIKELPNDLKAQLKYMLDGIGLDIVEQLQLQLHANKSIASGFLIDNIRYSVEGDNVISINMPFYGLYVEYGRPPGKMPPIDAIKEWCIIKGIDKDAAFPIAKTIQKLGTRPAPFVRPVIDTKLNGIIKSNVARMAR